jgi:hypothetical protein
MNEEYEFVGSGFLKTSDIPKDEDLYYRCLDCNGIIPSVPRKNVGCQCGNVFIDKDYWRLVVADLSRLEVLRKKK